MKIESLPRLTRRCVVSIVLSAVVSLGAWSAHAEDWPTRAVTLVVPYGPGASNDTFTRAFAEILTKKFGQPFVVENRAGAGGLTGANSVAHADPDGYTFLEAPNAIASFKEVMKYDLDPTKDLQAVTMFARAPLALIINKDVPANNVQEFIEYIKAQKENSVAYGLAGVGTTQHFLSEQFKLITGVKTKPVNYKSANDVTLDLVAGRLTYEFITTATVLGQLQSGELRILGYTNDSYSSEAPKAPLLSEQGIEGVETAQSWWGFFAPVGTPADIVLKMNNALNEALDDPSFSALLTRVGATKGGVTPQEFSKIVVDEAQHVAKLVKEANIVINK